MNKIVKSILFTGVGSFAIAVAGFCLGAYINMEPAHPAGFDLSGVVMSACVFFGITGLYFNYKGSVGLLK